MNSKFIAVRGAHRLDPVWLWLLMVGLALVLAGCGPGGTPATPELPTPAVMAQPVTPTLSVATPEVPAVPTSSPPAPTETATQVPPPKPTRTSMPTSLPTPLPTEKPTPTQAASTYSFAADVQPIFAARCIKCHTGDNPPRGLRLDSYEHVLAGSSQRPVVIPGNPQDSHLVKRIEGIARPRMPLDGPPFLSDKEIAIIEAWIAAGAPDN